MAERTIRSWFWFAGVALAIALPHPASAVTVIGGGPDVFLDVSAIDGTPAKRFAPFNHPALLMPGESAPPSERIILSPPGGRRSLGTRVMLTTPRGSSGRLLVPENGNPRIVLTPPGGMPVHLIPPSSSSVRLTPPGGKQMSALSKPKTRPVARPAPEAPIATKPKIDTPTTKPTVTSALPIAPPPTPVESAPPALPPSEGQPMPLVPPPAATPMPMAAAPEPAVPTVAVPTPVAEIPSPPAPAPLEPLTAVAVATPSALPAPPPAADVPVATPTAFIALVFDSTDARLNETHRALLKDVVAQLSQDNDASVQLLAYAQAENRSKARRLSLSRALAVRSYLLSQDVHNTRIEVRALGDQVPAGKPDRVDVILQRP